MVSAVSAPDVKRSSSSGIWVATVLVLCAVNLILLALLYSRPSSGSKAEPDNVIAQADKLFSLSQQFLSELETIAGQANYPTDTEKTSTMQILRDRRIIFEMVRIAHDRLRERKDRDSLVAFVQTSCGIQMWSGCEIVLVPSFLHFEPGKLDNGRYIESKTVPYANSSKLETIKADYAVLLTEMLKDVK